ncbi:MAG: hypothetical protein ACSLE1_03145 [Sphingobium sp.]
MSDLHTPGPWAVSKNSSGRRVTSTTGIVICNAVIRNSGSAKNGHKHSAKDVLEAEANARLIAVAPALLEALQEARAALHQHYVDWDGEPEDAVPLQLARSRCDAAISQAQGEG